MTDLILKIILWSILYGAACFGFGLYLGKTLKAVSSKEPEDLLEWPPYERHL